MMKLTSLTFILILISCASFAQGNQLDSLNKKFNRYRKQDLQEKIYAHTDRTSYLTGEIMWFNLYYVDASFHHALDVSKVAYVELIDNTNQSVLQTKVKMNKGGGNGSLFMPATLSSGNYTLRVYTNWMKNFNPDFYFHQTVTVINPFIKLDKEAAATGAVKINAQFFPEGGDLINGLPARVGFQFTDKEGRGFNLKGAIVNERNDTISRFKAERFGLGSFSFTPQAAENYRAVVKDLKGTYQFFPIAKGKESGCVMHVEEKENELEIQITRTNDESVPFIYLFAHAREITLKSETKFFQKDKATFTINKKDLAEGINQFTLFDDQLKPLAERLYFNKPAQDLKLSIASVQKNYTNRQKIVLNASANKDAQFSVSVFKLDSLNSIKPQTLFEYLWLSSDLGGKIESPEFYFSEDPNAKEATDLLMLTHGWRRFNWNDVLTNKNQITYAPEYRGHIINGKIFDLNNNPAKGITTYLSSPGKVLRIYGSKSNTKGEIRYEINLTGNEKIIVQTNTTLDSTYHFEITPPFSDKLSNYSIPPFQLSPSLESKLINRSVGMQVQDIYYKDKINQFITPLKDSVAFFGKPDEAYNLDDYTRFPIMEEVLREYVPGVMVRKRKDGFHFMVVDKVNKALFREDPLVLVDGMPVFDADRVMAFDPLKVKRLEVLDREYFIGPLGLHGIMSFTTYTNDLSGFPIDPKALTIDYEGLQLHREFYSPQYNNADERNNHLPDQRSLLYWNPSISGKKDKPFQVDFYTSDMPGTYQVIMQGITADGSAVSSSYTFTVTKENN